MTYADNPHKHGRPSRMARAALAVFSMRFTPTELAALAFHMERTGISRSDIVREAMRRAGLFGDAWIEFRTLEPERGFAENTTVRLTRPELEALDRHARRMNTKRAPLVRAAIDDMGLFEHVAIDIFPED